MRRKILLAFFCVIILLLAACAKEEKEIRCFSIETSYGSVSYPETYRDNLRYSESTNDGITVGNFSMVVNEVEGNLFEIVFGDSDRGSLVGYLNETPVTMTLFSIYDQSALDPTNEEISDLYRNMQGGLDYVLDSIYKNENYSADITAAAARGDLVLKYWAVSLPETMHCEEATEGDIYRATFYGDVAGKQIKLYTVYLGKVEKSDSLGTFNVNGDPKTISVEHYEMVQDPNWTAEEKMLAEYMYSSVTEVLEVIFNSSEYADRIT